MRASLPARLLAAALAAIVALPAFPAASLAATATLTLSPAGTVEATYGDTLAFSALFVDPGGPTPITGASIAFAATPFAGGSPLALGDATTDADGVATLGGNPVAILGGGHWLVTARWAGDDTWDPVTSAETDLTVDRAAQVITFDAPADRRLDQSPAILSATATSGLPVAFDSQSTGVCTVAGTTVTLLAIGTCTIRASQAGDANYLPGTPVSDSFAITKGNQVITFAPDAPTTAKANGPSYTPVATATSGLAVTEFGAAPVSVCQVNKQTGEVTFKNAGTCTVTANQAGDSNWNAAPQASHLIEVTGPEATTTAVTSSANPSTYGDAISFTATVSPSTATGSVQFVIDGASFGAPVTVAAGTATSGSTSALTGGTHTVQANFTTNDAVTYANSSGTLPGGQVVGRAGQTITFGALSNRTYGDGPFGVTASASSGLAVTFSSLTPGVCTVSASTVAIVGAGTCTIRASQPGDANFQPATDVDQSFTVAPATQAITFGQPPDRTFDESPVPVSATASSGLAVSFSSLTSGTCTVSGSTVTFVAVGACTILASQAGNANYEPAPDVQRTFAIGKGGQTITFAALGGKAFGDPPFSVAATASSGLAVAFSSRTTAVCTVSGSTVAMLAVGTCTIRASQAGNTNYNPAPDVDRSFLVGSAGQTIAFGALGGRTYGDPPFTVSATASSGLPVTFSSLATGVCTVAGSTVAIVGAGTCTIRASQAGDANYDPAPDVDRTFSVAKANQAITFGALAGRTYGDGPFGVTATASSGLAVTFSSLTPGICAASGSTVTMVGAGTCTIRASQAGNTNFNAALDVDRSFAIGRKAAVVVADPASRPYGAADPIFTATIVGLVPGDSVGTPTCTTSDEVRKPVGSYPITCTQGSLSVTDYVYTYQQGWLTVTPAPLTITADAKTRPYGLANPTPTWRISGFVLDETAATAADFGGSPACPPISTAVTAGVGTYPGAITCAVGTLQARNYAFTTFVDGALTIVPAQPTPVVTVNANPSALSEPVTFTARVEWSASVGAPAGTVTFFDDATAVTGPLTLVGGAASFTTSSLPLGDHAITATYQPASGVTNFVAASSPAFTQSIGTTAVDVELIADRTTWETNVPIRFTAAPRPRASRVTVPVTGQVVFAVDGKDRATVAIVGGSATYASPALSAGPHTVTARYVRDLPAQAFFTVGNQGTLARTVVTNTVSASGVGPSSTSVYPVRDTWKDTVAIRGTRNERASVAIRIYSPTGSRVRSVSIAAGNGPYSYTWNGRNSSGTVLAAGKYRVVQTLRDAYGASRSFTSYVTLSRRKMTWYTRTITVAAGPRRFSVAGDASIQSQYSTTSTRALTLSNPVTGQLKWLAVGYQFTLPSASTYTSLSFQVQGSWTGTTAPKIALVPWSSGNWGTAMYSRTRARASMDTIATDWDAHTLTNLTGVRSGRYVRAVIDSFDPGTGSGYAVGPYRYTITGVRLVVRYGILN